MIQKLPPVIIFTAPALQLDRPNAQSERQRISVSARPERKALSGLVSCIKTVFKPKINETAVIHTIILKYKIYPELDLHLIWTIDTLLPTLVLKICLCFSCFPQKTPLPKIYDHLASLEIKIF